MSDQNANRIKKICESVGTANRMSRKAFCEMVEGRSIDNRNYNFVNDGSVTVAITRHVEETWWEHTHVKKMQETPIKISSK